jgi:hypothetical protein
VRLVSLIATLALGCQARAELAGRETRTPRFPAAEHELAARASPALEIEIATWPAATPGEEPPLSPGARRPLAWPATDLACTLHSALHERTAGLWLDPELPPFAVQFRGEVTVGIPLGAEVPWVWVESESDDLSMYGIAPSAELSLYSRRPAVLGGFVAIGPSATLTLAGASGDGLVLSYAVPWSVAVNVGTVWGHLPCSELSLERGAYAELEAFALAGDALDEARRLGTGRVPLALVPGGSAVTTLEVTDPTPVWILEQRGNAARILVAREDDSIVGWVPVEALTDDVAELWNTLGTCSHDPFPRAPEAFPIDTLVCDRDLPLFAEVGEVRRTVGFLRAQHWAIITARLAAHYVIQPASAAIEILPPARLLVATSDLDGCRVRLAPGTQLRGEHRPGAAW